MIKMGTFKIIEEGAFADFEFEAKGDSLEDLFAVCGRATFEAMTDTTKVDRKKEIQLSVSADNLDDLMFSFLSELIYLKDVEKLFFSEFVINIDESYNLTCKAAGEIIDNDKHDLKTDVKAVTYHKLNIKKEDDGYSAHVILDL
jgi:SHS2 domain-containing protein